MSPSSTTYWHPTGTALSFVSPAALRAYEARVSAIEGIDDRQRLGQEIRLDDWVAVWWVEFVAELAVQTRHAYESGLRRFVLPHLGHIRLWELDTPTVALWADQLRRDGVTPHLIRHAIAVLSSCLSRASERGFMPYGNPAMNIGRPVAPRRMRRPCPPTKSNTCG